MSRPARVKSRPAVLVAEQRTADRVDTPRRGGDRLSLFRSHSIKTKQVDIRTDRQTSRQTDRLVGYLQKMNFAAAFGSFNTINK